MRDEEDPEREAARKALELRIEELAIRREQNHDIRYTALCVAREMQQVYREEENTLKTLTIICFICLGSLIAATVAVDATAQSPKTPRADLIRVETMPVKAVPPNDLQLNDIPVNWRNVRVILLNEDTAEYKTTEIHKGE